MSPTLIKILEKYIGLLLCFLLTIVHKVTSGISPGKNTPTQRIVFVKFIEQGALILHINAFKESSAKYGKENLYISTFTSNVPLLYALDIFPAQNILALSNQSITAFAIDFLRSIIFLRKRNVDTAIDLEFFSRSSAVYCFLSGATKRAGFHQFLGDQSYRGNLFTHRLSYSHYVHVADVGSVLLYSIESSGEQLPSIDYSRRHRSIHHQFIHNENDQNRFIELINKIYRDKKIIVLNPNFRDQLPLRQWEPRKYRLLLNDLLIKYPDFIFVFTGRDDEAEITNQFISSFKGFSNLFNWCGRTEIRTLLTLYNNARLLITSDSGPSHFASITSINTIVLFGPETPELYGPLSSNVRVLYKNLACSPCYNVYNNRFSACKNNICMKQITVQEVIEEADKILKG